MKSAPIAFDENIHDEALFYRLYDEAEIVRWRMTDVPWHEVDVDNVSPGWRALARETLIGELTTYSATERFFADFGDDADFTQWLTIWLYEETKHPSAFVKWLDQFGEKFDSDFMLQGRETYPFMPSKMGTLATNIISEMVAAAMYTAISRQQSCEPVLRQLCRNIGGDEARHAASFYNYGKRRLDRSETPDADRVAALGILYFWMTPGLNARVNHPVNLVANRYKTSTEIHEAIPREAFEAAIDNAYKRACRVFGSLLGLDIKTAKDVGELLAELQQH